jgi:CRP/FNR family cyclic AMP-dependent transcriptional regulator
MPSNIAAELLLEIPLLENLSVDEIRELLAVAEDRQYEADQTIFDAGTVERALYVVLYGQVEIRLPVTAWDEAVVTTITGPSVFGESSFFYPTPHTATAHCLTAVRAIRLTREAYDRLADTKPPVALKLASNAAEILAQRLQETDRWIEELLEQQQDAQTAASWGRFRSRVGFSFEPQRWGP